MPLLILLFPFLELWLLIQIGSEIGALTTIALLILSGVAGMQLLRLQGFNTLLKMNQTLNAGVDPSAVAIEGIMLALAGALFLFPGFISDAIAIVFIIPFTRHLIAKRWLAKMARSQTVHFHSQYRSPVQTDDVIEGEFTEVKPEDRRLK